MDTIVSLVTKKCRKYKVPIHSLQFSFPPSLKINLLKKRTILASQGLLNVVQPRYLSYMCDFLNQSLAFTEV